MTWIYALSAVGIVSLVSFAGVFALAIRETMLRRVVFIFVGLATARCSVMLLFTLSRSTRERYRNVTTGITIMSGILLFFALEKFLFWHHCHGEHEESCDTLTAHDHAPKHLVLLF